MYYILYEGLQIDSNEPVYCTVYNVYSIYIYIYIYIYSIVYTLYVHLNYNCALLLELNPNRSTIN